MTLPSQRGIPGASCALLCALLFLAAPARAQRTRNPSDMVQAAMEKAAPQIYGSAPLYSSNTNSRFSVNRRDRSAGISAYFNQKTATVEVDLPRFKGKQELINQRKVQEGGRQLLVADWRYELTPDAKPAKFRYRATTVNMTLGIDSPGYIVPHDTTWDEMETKTQAAESEARRKRAAWLTSGTGGMPQTTQTFTTKVATQGRHVPPNQYGPIYNFADGVVRHNEHNGTMAYYNWFRYPVFRRLEIEGVPAYMRVEYEEGRKAGHPKQFVIGTWELQVWNGKEPKTITAWAEFQPPSRSGDTPNKIEISISTNVHEVAYPERVVSEQLVVKWMRILMRAALDELGASPRPPAPPPPPDPQPVAPPPPVESPPVDPFPGAEPEPEVSAAGRIDEMDELLEGVETELQARLLSLQLVSQRIAVIDAELSRLRQLLSIDENEEAKAAYRRKIAELEPERAELRQFRDEIAKELAAYMDDKVRRIGEMYNEGRWGELDFNAYTRVLAAKERNQFLKAQAFLAMGEMSLARRFARQLQQNAVTRPQGFYIEAMAAMQEGDLIAALEGFRSARKRGYGSAAGESFASLEKKTEISILKALRGVATRTSSDIKADFDRWVKGKTLDGAQLPQGWFDKQWLRWMFYDSVTYGWGTVAHGLTGRAEVEANDAGQKMNELALTDHGLSIVIRLREGDYTLEQIRRMSDAQFREAAKKLWKTELTQQQALHLRQSVQYVFNSVTDLKTIASGETLTALDDPLSKPLVQRIERGGLWGLYDHFGSTGESALEVADPFLNSKMFAMMFAPGSYLGAAGTLRPMSSAVAASRFRDVSTLSQWFAATRPVQAMTRYLAATPRGAKFLDAMQKWAEWSGTGFFPAVGTGAVTVATEWTIASAAREYLGEEYAFLIDMMGLVGVTGPHLWSDAAKKLGVGGAQLREAADKMAAMGRAARQQANQVSLLADAARGLGDGAPNAAAIRSLRQNLARIEGAPPQLTSKIEQALEHFQAGRTQAGIQTLKDFNRARDYILTRAGQSGEFADHLRTASRQLPDRFGDPYASNGLRRQGLVREMGPRRPGTPRDPGLVADGTVRRLPPNEAPGGIFDVSPDGTVRYPRPRGRGPDPRALPPAAGDVAGGRPRPPTARPSGFTPDPRSLPPGSAVDELTGGARPPRPGADPRAAADPRSASGDLPTDDLTAGRGAGGAGVGGPPPGARDPRAASSNAATDDLLAGRGAGGDGAGGPPPGAGDPPAAPPEGPAGGSGPGGGAAGGNPGGSAADELVLEPGAGVPDFDRTPMNWDAPVTPAPAPPLIELRGPNSASALSHADDLLARGRYREALEEYQRILTSEQRLVELAQGDVRELRRLREEIQRIQAEIHTRIPLAESAEQFRNTIEQLRRNIAFSQPDPFQPQAWQTVEDALSGRAGGRRVIGEGDPHMNPTYYVDGPDGSAIAVAKNRYGSETMGYGTLDDGAGEVVMSRVYQSLGMRSPRREMMRVGNEIWTVSEIMPPGESFGNVMRNNPEATLVFKRDVARDSVARMIGGDPDAHFGNLRVGDNGDLIPFDNNLARPSPTHPVAGKAGPFDPSAYSSAAELDEALEQWVRQDMDWVWNQTTRNWDGGALPVRQTVRWEDFDKALRRAEALTPRDLDWIHGADHLPTGADAALNRKTMELRIKHLREFLRQRIPGAPSARVIEFVPPGRDGFKLRVAAVAA